MSRNKERTGAQNVDTSPPPQALQDAASDGFSFVVPTEFVELPSKGRYYPENHPLHNADSIEIKQMTAKEEDILTSRTLLKKGVALDRVIQNIIVDRKINPDSLLVGDRNAIVIACRVSGYGSEYTTQVTCPACEEKQKYSFDLNEAEIQHGEELQDAGITDNENGTFDITLPRTGVTVTFKLLNGIDEKKLLSGMEKDRKSKSYEKTVTRQLVNTVVAVNGDTSADAINYLVLNIPSIDSRHLRMAVKLASPNVDLTQVFQCAHCSHEQDMEVPLTADFFWPDS